MKITYALGEPFPILPDQIKGCPYITSNLAEICKMGSESAAKKFCKLGCSPICAQLMIQEAMKRGKWRK